MQAKHANGRIVTTVGDLIVALSEAAFELCDDRKAAYVLTSLALAEILSGHRPGSEDPEELASEPFMEATVH